MPCVPGPGGKAAVRAGCAVQRLGLVCDGLRWQEERIGEGFVRQRSEVRERVRGEASGVIEREQQFHTSVQFHADGEQKRIAGILGFGSNIEGEDRKDGFPHDPENSLRLCCAGRAEAAV